MSRDPLEENGGTNLYGPVYNDPINGLDTDGRFGFYPLGLAYKLAGAALHGLADITGIPVLGAAAQLAGDLFSQAGRYLAPSFPDLAKQAADYVDHTVSRYDTAGKIYDEALGSCGNGNELSAAWDAGAFFLGDFFGLNGLPEGIYGVDLGTGDGLSQADAWGRFLTGAGTTALFAAPAVAPFKVAKQPLSLPSSVAAETTAPRFLVTESGVAVPADAAELRANMQLLQDTSTSPVTSRKFVGTDSQGPLRVRIEQAHPETPGYTGPVDPLHTVDHLHIDRRANGSTGPWQSNEKLPYDWPFQQRH